MRKILLIVALLYGIQTAMSQTKGSNIIGIKIGYVVGVNYEHFFTDHSSLEADLEYDFKYSGLTVMPIYKYHFALGANFSANVGGGVNLSWYSLAYKPTFVFGLNPTVGVDYSFSRVGVGIYYRPQLNIGYGCNWANFGLRFGVMI